MENKVCKFCASPLDETFNFCPHCGTANSAKAKQLEAEHKKLVQLQFIANLVGVVKDKNTLVLLEKLGEKLSK